jgi:uncharacterized RmlC-like cupin family protein
MIGAGKPDSRHEHELASPDQNQTSLYVILGTAQVEFGPAGSAVFECGSSNFIHVPGGTVHPESNPSSAEATTVMTRACGVPKRYRWLACEYA